MNQPTALQHSKTSDNKDNSLQIAHRVIATTKSVNDILSEKLKTAEALAKKLGFDLDRAKKKARSDKEKYDNLLKYSENLNQVCKELKLRAEVAEAKSVEFDRRLDSVKQERDYQVRSYRQFLERKKLLAQYDSLRSPATEKLMELGKGDLLKKMNEGTEPVVDDSGKQSDG